MPSIRNPRSFISLSAGAAVTILLLGGATHAQPLPTVDPKACAPGDRLQSDQGEAKTQRETTGENLSDKLARTDGVICPPDVGPDMRLKAPETDAKTPVIPPAGAPGGDPSVRPK
jgi:hypothetical protein